MAEQTMEQSAERAIERERGDTPWVLAAWWQTGMVQWRQAWAEIPAAAWKRWLVTLTIGWVISLFVVLGAIWLLQSPLLAGYVEWEPTFLQMIVDTRFIEPASANWMNIPGHPLYLVLIISIVLFTAIRLGRLIEGVTILGGFMLVTASVGLGWFLWSRDRPDLVLDGAFAPGLNSFPSGHTAQATVVYGLLAFYWIRHSTHFLEKAFATLLLGGAILIVCVGRLWIAAHWPSDVFVGLIIGLIVVAGLAFGVRRGDQVVAEAQGKERVIV